MSQRGFTVPMLPKSSEVVDIAFRRARKEAAKLKSQRDRLKDAKGKEIKKIETSSSYFTGTLHMAIKGFPSVRNLHPFYRELISATIDLNAMLRALGQMDAATRIAVRLKRQHIGRIKSLHRGEERKAAGIVREWQGRLASLARSLGKGIEAYNENARKMRELPSVDFELPTVIIAGYPNTGKSTILGRLTKSRPKVASYPFTTQQLQIGYLIHNYDRVQLIDTPGLLDRPLGERNKAERKAIAALKHLANAIVFVVDPTMRCGFELQKQGNLLLEIKKEFGKIPIIVVLNKADIATGEEMQQAEKAFPDAIVEGEGIESRLRGEIAKAFLGAGKKPFLPENTKKGLNSC